MNYKETFSLIKTEGVIANEKSADAIKSKFQSTIRS